ncbi:MAG: hypothetical protein R3195_16540 [Gemmatimonadota bacterium]|nr:hypothetical protein [Gemmatimonadota bacterium]
MSYMAISYAGAESAARDLTLERRRRRSRFSGSGVGGVGYVSAYSQEELIEDARRRARGERLSCPGCGWTDPPERERRLFDVYIEKGGVGRLAYGYRLCKVCGFAQDADGGECYRVWLSAHRCAPRGLAHGVESISCRHCSRQLAVTDGVAEEHTCGKYLRQGDSGYCCATCGEWQGPASERPLPGDRRTRVREEESPAA